MGKVLHENFSKEGKGGLESILLREEACGLKKTQNPV